MKEGTPCGGFDTELEQAVRTIDPVLDITNNAGRLAGDINDDPYVTMFTETDDETATRFIKVNIETGEVVWDRSYPFANDAGGYNDNGRSDILFAEDGFLYATIHGTSWLVRIDPETCYLEPARIFGQGAGRFDALGNDLYLAGATAVRRVRNFKVVYDWPGDGTPLILEDSPLVDQRFYRVKATRP